MTKQSIDFIARIKALKRRKGAAHVAFLVDDPAALPQGAARLGPVFTDEDEFAAWKEPIPKREKVLLVRYSQVQGLPPIRPGAQGIA